MWSQPSASQSTSLTAETRELLIQKAALLRKQERYYDAVKQLDSILAQNSRDAQVLLFRGDLLLQNGMYAKAVDAYRKLLPLNYEATITTINLSYALFMNHKPKKALIFAKKAWLHNKTHSNAIINYFNALLWNRKTIQAALFLKKQDSLLTKEQKNILNARLFTSSGDYKKGVQLYDSLIKIYPNKYYIQEYAEVLLGKKQLTQSVNIMDSSQQFFTVKELSSYMAKAKETQQQRVGTEVSYFKDVAQNKRIDFSVWWQQPEVKKYSIRTSTGISTITAPTNEKTTAYYAQTLITERWSMAWTGETHLRLNVIKPINSNSFSSLTGQQSIKFQPNDRRMIGLLYNTDILNYTANLLGKNIRSNNVGYITHLMMTGNDGFYSQGSAGWLSDKNQRYQFFGSLYHLFRTEPTLKAGVSVAALHFKDSTIKYYFSPNRYINSEAFFDFSTPLPSLSKFYLQGQLAGGLQQIERQNWEPAFRLQTELGLRLKHFETSLKYQTSNVASNTGSGYKFNWFTLRVNWKW